MRLLIAALAVAASSAVAAPVAHSHLGDWVMLTENPCPEAIAAKVMPDYRRPMLRAAKTVIAGKPFAACWLIDGAMAHLVYEDGDEGMVPLTDFHESPEV